MGVGWLAIAAAEAAAQTTSIEEVCALVREMRSRTLVLGVLDSLKHLRYGGRVGWAAAQVVDFLQIKPIISFENSNAHFVGRVRTYRKALHQLIRRVQDEAPLERLAIIHSRVGREVLADLKEALQPYVTLYPIQIVEVGPIFGTHVGPRGIGVALVRAKER